MDYLTVYREIGNAVIIVGGLVWFARSAYPQFLDTVRYCTGVFREVMTAVEASRAADRESCRAEREAADAHHAGLIREILATHERWKEIDHKARHDDRNAAQRVIVDMFFATRKPEAEHG